MASKWSTFRSKLRQTWKKDPDKALTILGSWLDPLEKRSITELHAAHSFLGTHETENSKKIRSDVKEEISKRTISKPSVELTAEAESCVFDLIGTINGFLRSKSSLHHPNKKEIIKQANQLLNECFECKRSIHELKAEDEKSASKKIATIDKKIVQLQKKIEPIAKELSEYKSELEKLAELLRKY